MIFYWNLDVLSTMLLDSWSYLNLSSVLFWHQTWHKKGVATLVLSSGDGSPDSSVGVGKGCSLLLLFRGGSSGSPLGLHWYQHSGWEREEHLITAPPMPPLTALGVGGWKCWFSTRPFLTPPWQGWPESLLPGKVAVQVSHVVYTDTAKGAGRESSSQHSGGDTTWPG